MLFMDKVIPTFVVEDATTLMDDVTTITTITQALLCHLPSTLFNVSDAMVLATLLVIADVSPFAQRSQNVMLFTTVAGL